MTHRRLVVLFIFFAVLALVLALRLAELQLVQTEHWRTVARDFAMRHDPLDTNRGSIVDRNGRPLAVDRPCYDLAIQYQAMNYDDRWLYWAAVDRMKSQGITDRKERLRQLAATKAAIADQIEHIPWAVAKLCHVPVSQVLQRSDEIRQKITALRQYVWSQKYDPQKDQEEAAAGTLVDLAPPPVWEETIAHTLVPDVPRQVAWYLDKHRDEYPGLRVQSSVRREYPYGDVACHIIGTMRPVDRQDVSQMPFDRPDLLDDEPGNLKGYLPGDDIGASGIERMEESKLRGTRGIRLLEMGVGEVAGKRIAPVAGQSVRLTIDAELQKAITRKLQDPTLDLLKGQDGQNHNVALVVLDITNGDIIAMISTPTYDLNTYRDHVVDLIHDDVNMPLMNRALQASYPPGSIAKPLVAAAALHEHLVTPDETVICNGHLYPNLPGVFRCWIYVDYHATHGPVQLASALEQSCNIYFYTMGQRLGLHRMIHYFGRFGFGRTTGIGMREEQPGMMASMDDVTDPLMRKNQATLMGIGQGPISVTPLQMAEAYATLLRAGSRVRPRISLDQPVETGTPWIDSQDVLAIRKGMELVVEGGRGTAHKFLRQIKLPLGGKTGSATATRTVTDASGHRQQVQGTDAWFVAYAPAEQPRYVFVALKEFGGHGGTEAVPVVREAILEMERRGYLPPVDVDTQVTER